MANPIVWGEIYVQDMARARKFYETVLNVRLQNLEVPAGMMPGMEMAAFPAKMEAPGATGALVRMPGVPSGGSTILYFGCEDCAVEAGRVEKAGGKIHKSKFSIGKHGFIALAVDTEGNMFGLYSMK